MKKYFITGLLVWLPLAITLWMLHFIISSLDQTVLLLPADWQPQKLIGFSVPGLGLLLTLVVVCLTGMIATNIIGQSVLRFWEALLRRIPVVKSIYPSIKQVADALLSSNAKAFRKAVLIEYPTPGVWTIAFVTGSPSDEVAACLGEDYLAVYVPTTPNPTSGFFLLLPRTKVVELDMRVDQALKYVISMGVVPPINKP
jgi:uncharacterized membrane protein